MSRARTVRFRVVELDEVAIQRFLFGIGKSWRESIVTEPLVIWSQTSRTLYHAPSASRELIGKVVAEVVLWGAADEAPEPEPEPRRPVPVGH